MCRIQDPKWCLLRKWPRMILRVDRRHRCRFHLAGSCRRNRIPLWRKNKWCHPLRLHLHCNCKHILRCNLRFHSRHKYHRCLRPFHNCLGSRIHLRHRCKNHHCLWRLRRSCTHSRHCSRLLQMNHRFHRCRHR